MIIGTTTEMIDALKERFEKQNQLIERLRAENKRLEAENYKDEELAKMKNRIDTIQDEYQRGFPISKDQSEAIHNWYIKHRDEKHKGNYYTGAIGGGLTYSFIPTSIGTVGTVKCSCGEEFCFCELE